MEPLLENNDEMSWLVFGLGLLELVGDCSDILSTSLSRFRISWI